MKNAFTIIVLIVLCSNFTFSQNLNGRYEGAVTRDGSIQLVNFDFHYENDNQKGTYEIPEIGVYNVPIDNISLKNDTLNLKFYYGNIFCFIGSDKEQITGISEYWLPKLRLHVKKTTAPKKPYIREDITFYNGDLKLSGMVYHPRSKLQETSKYVVLVHGSGNQTRYAPYYISLGHLLSKKGVGVLLYDKRGTGASEGNFEKASMEDLAEDAFAALNYLKNRTDIKISDIGFLATSQGGWIAPIAANKKGSCDFLILNVSPSVSVFEQDIHRVKYSMESDGWNQATIDSALYYTQLYFEFTKNNKTKTWKKLKKLSQELKEKEWAEYLNIPENKEDFTWWRLNDYDPLKALSGLKCRTLCIYGEHDRLVPPKENQEKMHNYLTQADIEFEIKVIKGAYHNMQTSHGLNGKNWDWPKVYWQWRKQPEEFIDTIIEFIDEN